METVSPRLSELEMMTALRRGMAMFHRHQSEELFDESRALRAEASLACGRSVELMRARRAIESPQPRAQRRRSAEPGDRRAQVHPD